MRIPIAVKYAVSMLVTFFLLFLASLFLFATRFEDRYIDENITAVKTAIETSAADIRGGDALADTSLAGLSGETSIVRFQTDAITDSLGPEVLNQTSIIEFVIGIYDDADKKTAGDLTYVVIDEGDATHVRYVYTFDAGDYLIVLTDIQSLRYVDRVIADLGFSQMFMFFIVILAVSIGMSYHFTRPVKRLVRETKRMSDVDFSPGTPMQRRDEIGTLARALDDMRLRLRQAFLELNRANERLAADIAEKKVREQEKKQQIVTVNHELKTPLAVIRGMVEGMIDNVGRYKDKERYLKEVLTQVDQIETIAADLTRSMRLADKASADESCRVGEIRRRLYPMEALAEIRGVDLAITLPPATLRMNQELCVIFMQNLIKNAIIHTNGDRVVVRGTIDGDAYVITVTNPGHLEGDADMLFKQPAQTDDDDVSLSEGWGYGLFIVGQIADLHDADITLKNKGDDVVAEARIPRMEDPSSKDADLS